MAGGVLPFARHPSAGGEHDADDQANDESRQASGEGTGNGTPNAMKLLWAEEPAHPSR